MPIDYSKWDKFQDSSSDEEEEQQRQPRVTKLDAPSRISTQSDGSILVHSSDKNTKKPKSQPLAKQDKEDISLWSERGGLCTISVNKNEGSQAQQKQLYWTQDRYSVSLRIGPVVGKTRWKIEVENMLPYADRYAAAGTVTLPILVISCTTDNNKTTPWLREALPHPVHRAAEDDSSTVDWTVETRTNEKYLTLVLHKAVPMEGLTLWWNRPLAVCAETDISSWRQKSSDDVSSFQQAWNEAHAIFQKNTADRRNDPSAFMKHL